MDRTWPRQATGSFRAGVPVGLGMNFLDAKVHDFACTAFDGAAAFIGAKSFNGQGGVTVDLKQQSLDTLSGVLGPMLASVIKIPGGGQTPIGSQLGVSVYLDAVTVPGQVGPTGVLNPGSMGMALGLNAGQVTTTVGAAQGSILAYGRVHDPIVGWQTLTITFNNAMVSANISFDSSGNPHVTSPSVKGDFAFNFSVYPNWVGSLFESKILAGIQNAITTQVPPIVAAAIAGIRGNIHVPSLPGAQGTGGGTLAYAPNAVTVTPTEILASVLTTYPGAPMLTSGQPFAFPGISPAGVGIEYDTLNQALYSLWKTHGLNTSLSSSEISKLGNSQQINVAFGDPGLPPVVSASPPGGATTQVRVGIGQLPVTLYVQSASLTAKVDAVLGVIADVNVTTTSTGVMGTLAKMTTFRVDMQSTVDLDDTAAATGLTTSGLVALFQSLVGSSAVHVGQWTATLQLPVIDLSSSGVPVKMRLASPEIATFQQGVVLSGALATQ